MGSQALHPLGEYGMSVDHWSGREDLIAELYATFAHYTVKHPLVGCPCCVGADDQRTIRTPLRELSADALARYSAKAMSTWGGVEDYKHFLPRILELLGSVEADSCHGFQVWLVAGKLTYAQWRTWPANERVLIGRFFHELWLAFLDADDPDPSNADMIDAIRGLGEELGPWLAHWDPMRSARIAGRLAEAVVERQRGDEEFGRWLRSAARLRALEEAFETYMDTPQADRIAAAVDHLRSTRGVR